MGIGEDVLRKVRALLIDHALCVRCLGRLFALMWPDRPRSEIGSSLMEAAFEEAMRSNDKDLIRGLARSGHAGSASLLRGWGEGEEVGAEPCELCGGKVSSDSIGALVRGAAEKASAYEYSTFSVGTFVPPHVRSLEDHLISAYGLEAAESIRRDVTREARRLFAELTGKQFAQSNPELEVLLDPFTSTYEVRPSPVMVRGRYLKHSRSTPQTPWLCDSCWGRGCDACGYTGRREGPDLSIAEYIGLPALELWGAMGFTFHAAGREDLDAAVEGTGRPFVLELSEPRRRRVDLEEFARRVREFSNGKVEVIGLGPATRADVRFLKTETERKRKVYLVRVAFSSPVPADEVLRACGRLRGSVIEQRTPTRVLRRRGDRLRKRTVHEVTAVQIDERTYELTLVVDGGLYVKELIHGDNGRTRPSLRELLGVEPERIELTVLGVQEPSGTAQSSGGRPASEG
ncbi:MAG: tRNA pseudouridine(54/55) synthase Pus10 [Nitrososphaerota archaeon]